MELENSDEPTFELDLKGQIKNNKSADATFEISKLWTNRKLDHRVILKTRTCKTMGIFCDKPSERTSNEPSNLCKIPALGHFLDEVENIFRPVLASTYVVDEGFTYNDILD
ncbi:uncharacterized protein FRV6_06849 [Fusarium oxysporum]|uniref:Uncharacterized protein n=1 Tax=Fusarium oxysporum TaxID=5507 RepID=A0A2H3T1Q8_FUSOX|nr:uncharacterized protein FRV6_06849 [Fusarium oxysporum]